MGLAGGLALVLGMAWAAQEALAPPPATYSAKPTRGVVVDGETGQPLEGVVVVAQWVLFISGPGHGGHGPRLHMVETGSDSQGTYSIPGWGPERNPRYPWSRLLNEDPMLSFFKPGYRPLTVQNRWDRNDPVRFSEWDGKTINLEKFKGMDKEWAGELRFLQTTLGWVSKDMDWRLMPRMGLALELERLRLAQNRVGIFDLSPLSSLGRTGTTVEEVRRFLESQK